MPDDRLALVPLISMPQRNLWAVLLVAAVSYACYIRGEQNPFARHASSTYEVIDGWALDQVPDQALFDGALEGMVSVLRRRGDEHSQYISPADAGAFEAEMRQQFGGIGVRIRPEGEPPQPTVIGPPEPGSPAQRGGIQPGDVIIAIDGQPTAAWDMMKILRNMRGEVGEPIELTVLHAGDDQPETIRLVREIIVIDSILGDRRRADGTWQFQLDDHPRVALVRIVNFGDKTIDELREVLTNLPTQVEAVVLDLRDNAGGALTAAVGVSDLFLAGGKAIVETRGRDGDVRDRWSATGTGEFQRLPLAVLINQNTASASEIVAAAVQDHGRAAVIGQRSFGKGTVQRVLHVGSRGTGRLNLTTSTYWRPSGANIHRMPGDSEDDDWGVVPDEGLNVALTEDQYLEFRKYRNQRDLIQEDAGGQATATSHDVVLETAVQRLETMLDATSPPRS